MAHANRLACERVGFERSEKQGDFGDVQTLSCNGSLMASCFLVVLVHLHGSPNLGTTHIHVNKGQT